MLVQLDPEMFLNLRFTRAAETDKEYRSMENIEIPRFYYSIKFILVRMIQKIQNEFTQTIVQVCYWTIWNFTIHYIYRCKDRFDLYYAYYFVQKFGQISMYNILKCARINFEQIVFFDIISLIPMKPDLLLNKRKTRNSSSPMIF